MFVFIYYMVDKRYIVETYGWHSTSAQILNLALCLIPVNDQVISIYQEDVSFLFWQSGRPVFSVLALNSISTFKYNFIFHSYN